jgi:Dam-replacing HTH domain
MRKTMEHRGNTFLELLYNLAVRQQAIEFTLDDIYRYRDELQRCYPENRNLDAKIRQGLQELRDEGIIEFVDNNGRYRRLDI